MDRVRAGFDRDVWKELAEAGVFTLPELGFGLPEEAVVFEELGRALVPGPLVWGALDALSVGESRHRRRPAAVSRYVRRRRPRLGDVGDSGRAIRSTRSRRCTSAAVGRRRPSSRCPGAILTAAYLVGHGRRVHRRRRRLRQGTRAVRHAHRSLPVDQAPPAPTAWCGPSWPAPRCTPPRSSRRRGRPSAAKVLAGDAAVTNASTSFQVHGGMGFTWEVDVHLYLKRAWMLDRQFGTADGTRACSICMR